LDEPFKGTVAMAEINDSRAGRYGGPFRDAVVRFMSQIEDEPWEIRGFDSHQGGITVEMRIRTEIGSKYSLFVVPQSLTLSDDILLAMNDVRESFLSPKHI
jgi:hypothetical protein